MQNAIINQSTTTATIYRKSLRILLKRAVDLVGSNQTKPVFGSYLFANDFETNDDDEEDGENADYNDFVDFLHYLTLRNLKLNNPNRTLAELLMQNYPWIDRNDHLHSNRTGNESSSGNNLSSDEYEMPVALVQLFILVLVFLITLFMCKCNQLMRACREKTEKSLREVEEDNYQDRMGCKQYLCFIWYNFKKRRRFNKRRRRRIRYMNNNAGRSSYRGSGSSTMRVRKNSLIFRRRSVIYRNNRKCRTNTSNQDASMTSFKKSVKRVNNRNVAGADGGEATLTGAGGNATTSTGLVDQQRGDKVSNMYERHKSSGSIIINFNPMSNPENELYSNDSASKSNKNVSIFFDDHIEEIV